MRLERDRDRETVRETERDRERQRERQRETVRETETERERVVKRTRWVGGVGTAEDYGVEFLQHVAKVLRGVLWLLYLLPKHQELLAAHRINDKTNTPFSTRYIHT